MQCWPAGGWRGEGLHGGFNEHSLLGGDRGLWNEPQTTSKRMFLLVSVVLWSIKKPWPRAEAPIFLAGFYSRSTCSSKCGPDIKSTNTPWKRVKKHRPTKSESAFQQETPGWFPRTLNSGSQGRSKQVWTRRSSRFTGTGPSSGPQDTNFSFVQSCFGTLSGIWGIDFYELEMNVSLWTWETTQSTAGYETE